MTGPVVPVSAPVAATSAGVGSDTSRLNTRANLDKAGEQFEAIFMRMMLKSMRSAKLADPLFDSKALDQFRDMQDQQLADSMAATTPLGIGKAMTDFLGAAQPTRIAAGADGADSTGDAVALPKDDGA